MNDFESAVREMLRTRAGDITELPERLVVGDPAATDHDHATRSSRPPGRRSWLPALLTAAAVVAVAVGVTIGIRVTNSSETLQHRTSTSPPPQPTTTEPSPTPAPTNPQCIAPLRLAWQQAIDRATVTAPQGWLLPPLDVAVAGNGDVIAVEYTAQFPRTYKLVRIGADQQIHDLYAPPSESSSPSSAPRIGAVAADGSWVAFTLAGAAGRQDRISVQLLNLATGARTTVRTLPVGTVTPGSGDLMMGDGAVYWAEIDAAQGYGSLYRYDIGSGDLTDLDEHATSPPLAVVGGGVYWNHGGRYGETPPEITITSSAAHAFVPDVDWARALAFAYPVYVDGPDGSIVWQDTSGAVRTEQPVPTAVPTTVVPARQGPVLGGVTGNFVWGSREPQGEFVVDLQSGAAGWLPDVTSFAAGRGSVAVLSPESDQLAVLDTSTMPALEC